MKEYLSSIDEVLSQQKATAKGLTSAQAEKRLEEAGKNKLIEGAKTSLVKRFLQQLTDPMIIILLAAAAVSGIMAVYEGESFTDVIIILLVVIINAVLGVVQENKAEKAIAALQEIAAATSKVFRDGYQITVKSEDIVPGDIIILEAGDSVPADARVIECASLKIEEAALTGESLPVTKTQQALTSDTGKDVPLGDRKNMVYMGSTVVYGRGQAVITGTGMNTEMGKIADALSKAENNQTPLQIKLNQLSKTLSFLVLGICAVIFAMNLFRAYPDFTSERLLDTFMVAISLAVAAIPEGLAAVVTIVLSMGVTKMSKQNAVIRKLTAVETLGCAQVICSDKTGTLTQNKMTVVDYYGSDETKLAKAMALCCDAELDPDKDAVGEPTECALVNYAYKLGMAKPDLKEAYVRIGEAPFDSMRKMMSTVHQVHVAPEGSLLSKTQKSLGITEEEGTIIQFTKGAPDEILKRCKKVLIDGQIEELTEERKEAILTHNKEMADQALRVLCAAMRIWTSPPADYEDRTLEQELIFIGLTGMIDPVRPEVKPAIDECRMAGIRPIMITGDHRDTAVAIATQLGIIDNPDQAITGAALDDLSDEELEKQIEHFNVYARVQPEHKVRIVNAWRAKGKITAMTGDGVNDAPSIKNADIGVGMGITGTDVTKNVADMVLADDNFATIVTAVGEGRRIYDNIRKAIQFLLASNLSEVVAIFVATILGFTILKPIHLLWINLVTDCFPALALGMEESEDDIMKRKPREATDGIFAGGVGFNVLFQGVMVAVITLTAYLIGHYIESGKWEFVNSADGMTMAFLTLSMAEICHSFNMRSLHQSIFKMNKRNKYLWGAAILSLISTTAVIYVPFLAKAFGFEPITIEEYGISLALAITVIPIVEVTKLIQRKWRAVNKK